MRSPTFRNEHCSFHPFKTTVIEGEMLPLGYKVVTDEYLSLNLRRNIGCHTPPEARILRFQVGSLQELAADMVVPGSVDWGGIWCARTPGNANSLFKYYERTHGPARILVCALKDPLFAKIDRIKSRGVYPIEEVNLLR